MSDPAIDPVRLAELRGRAASRLTGAAAGKGPLHRMSDALSALHALASAPQTAPDALALLHELQVHQVELDLQAQELQESRAELESALRRQIELYDAQPVGCLTTDRRLIVSGANPAAAEMLGVVREEVAGLNLALSFSASDRRALEDLVARAVAGEGGLSQALQLRPRRDAARSVQVSLRCEPAGERCFVVLTGIQGRGDPSSGA
ncbi:MAG: PAS domain-containing protein [Burkholderiaceae bacterium]